MSAKPCDHWRNFDCDHRHGIDCDEWDCGHPDIEPVPDPITPSELYAAAAIVTAEADEPPPACGLPRPSADTICILPEDHVSAWHEDVNGKAWL